jgi:hypothetical protein
MIVQADKGKITVIIGKNALKHKIKNFLHENQFLETRLIPQRNLLHNYGKLLTKNRQLFNKKRSNSLIPQLSTAPKIQVRIKTHKDNYPIRTVVNNINYPTHKIAKVFSNILLNLIQLPFSYNVTNLAQDRR